MNDSDIEEIYDNDNYDDYNPEEALQEALQENDFIDNQQEDTNVGENDISKKKEYIATVKGVSVQAIIEGKILHAIGDDEGLLQRLKQKYNILYFNPAMLQDAYEVITGKQTFSLKKYPTREIQADFIRYHKLLSNE
jgi:hypothetical protein